MELATLMTGDAAAIAGQAMINLVAIVGALKVGLAGLEKRCDRIEAKVDSLGVQGSTQGERIARLEAQGDRSEARDMRAE